MEEYREKWSCCLQMIKEQLNSQHVFDVWFSGIVFEDYDAQAHTVMLQVPNTYVYEYIEQCHVQLMQKVLSAVFGPGTRLQYRLARQARQEPTFADVADYLSQHGYNPRRDPFHIRIPNARKRLEDGLRYFLGDGYTWLPAYDQIADWLTDNKGRGLLCVGTPGLGKTLICEKILPVILGNGGHPIPFACGNEICQRLDDLLKERIAIIDDLGKEPAKATVNYQHRRPFFELCNNAVRNDNLLIITTNLSPNAINNPDYPDSIERKYGREVLDRLKTITKAVLFSGKSMWGG